ncbi:uncharacterized protein LOC113748748 [Coffea eugenioides]|uniref:uncharacterized protein LOC113748748 n=1 Tax=Coffea eugenioides TaxID=49369 RepID=UPI000F60E921|nr:uncharacterized protein LOC113748748 [Coffea eugenioides]
MINEMLHVVFLKCIQRASCLLTEPDRRMEEILKTTATERDRKHHDYAFDPDYHSDEMRKIQMKSSSTKNIRKVRCLRSRCMSKVKSKLTSCYVYLNLQYFG